MAEVSIAGGAAGSDIALSGNDALFQVLDGEVEFSTDNGTTYQAYQAPEEITFYDGTTVKGRNSRPVTARFKHMPY